MTRSSKPPAGRSRASYRGNLPRRSNHQNMGPPEGGTLLFGARAGNRYRLRKSRRAMSVPGVAELADAGGMTRLAPAAARTSYNTQHANATNVNRTVKIKKAKRK